MSRRYRFAFENRHRHLERQCPKSVESRCDAVALGVACGRVEDGRGSLGPMANAPFPIPARRAARVSLAATHAPGSVRVPFLLGAHGQPHRFDLCVVYFRSAAAFGHVVAPSTALPMPIAAATIIGK